MARKTITTVAALMAFFASYSSTAISSYIPAHTVNNPPVITGFRNPSGQPLSYVRVLPGSEVKLTWLDVIDPEGDFVASSLERIVDGSGRELDVADHLNGDGLSFEKPGLYSATFKATDGYNETEKDIYFSVSDIEQVLDKEQLKLYHQVKEHQGKIAELGEKTLLGYFNLLALADAESDFKHTKVIREGGKVRAVVNSSTAGAKGWFQVTQEGLRGIERKADQIKTILSTVFDDYEKLADISLENYTSDLESIDPADYGWNEEKYQRLIAAERIPVNTKERIMHVHVPGYIALSKIFPDLDIDGSRISEKDYNARLGSAKLLLNYLELSSLEAVGKDGKLRWVYQPRRLFEEEPGRQAFDFDDAVASYNAGIGALKKAYVRAMDGNHEPIDKLTGETRTHRKRWKESKNRLTELDDTLRGYDFPRRYKPEPADLI